MKATWAIWLIKRGDEPLCYCSGMNEREALRWTRVASRKVFDGSDADAFMLLRSDKHPNGYQ